MKTLLLILVLVGSAYAQEVKNLDSLKWKPIREMSGNIPGHEGLTVEVFVAEIARREDGVRVIVRAEYPWGTPSDLFIQKPHGFDATSFSKIVFRVDLNCNTRYAKSVSGSADGYQVTGRRLKIKEIPAVLEENHVFVDYFCERGAAPTAAPKLKPKP